MTFKPLFGQITILSLILVNFRVSRFHVSHLTHKTFKLCLQNTLNMSKTARVYFGVLHIPFVWSTPFLPFSLFLISFYFIILLMTSYPTWLNMSHGIMPPMWLNVSHSFFPSVTLLRCHVASPNLAMCHPTPYASKNVKSRSSRNPTKFNVVTKFRETISTEKSVSSSEI